ncbi:MAG: hypothetical protein ACRC92_26605 [Peptostreptococcaceae bacterium]
MKNILAGMEVAKVGGDKMTHILAWAMQYPSTHVVFGNSSVETSYGIVTLGSLFDIDGEKVYKSITIQTFASGYKDDMDTNIIVSNVYNDMMNHEPRYGLMEVAELKGHATTKSSKDITASVHAARKSSMGAMTVGKLAFSKYCTVKAMDSISRVVLLDTLSQDDSSTFSGIVNGIQVMIKSRDNLLHFTVTKLADFADKIEGTPFEDLYHQLDESSYIFTISLPVTGKHESSHTVVRILDLIRYGITKWEITPRKTKGLLAFKVTEMNF